MEESMAIIEDWRTQARPELTSIKEAQRLYEAASESYLKALKLLAEVQARENMKAYSRVSNLTFATRLNAESVFGIFMERARYFIRTL